MANKKMLKIRLRIKTPTAVLFFTTLALGGFLFKLFFPFASEQSSATQKKKTSQTLFLEHLMIREAGLYTLLGSKPVTAFDATSFQETSEEAIKKRYEARKAFLEKAKREEDLSKGERTASNPYKVTLPSYATYKQQCEKYKHLAEALNYKKLWEDWKKEDMRLDPKFLFCTKKWPNTNAKTGLFVNIPNLVYVLYHHKQAFTRRTGFEFQPEKEVFEIPNGESLFWNRVFQDDFLLGLILGYGEKSAYLFEWKKNNLSSLSKETIRLSARYETSLAYSKLKIKQDISPRDLLLPTYFHFGVSDPKKQEYEEERKKIIDHFDNTPFELEVMRILKGE